MADLIQQTEAYVTQLLTEQLTEDHQYHNLGHTQAVVDMAKKLGQAHGLRTDEQELLELAAWFHDTGFTTTYEGHEEAGTVIAEQFLREHGYPQEKIAAVQQLIRSTHMAHTPANPLEALLSDADLSNLAREDYLTILAGLRHEWSIYRDETYEDRDWFELNYQFVSSHSYHTAEAVQLFESQHRVNARTLQKLAKKKTKKKKKKKKKKNDRTGDTIATNRSAQMMFKTALRNHMDLSNLADNKANIMLSVNALIVTIAVPMGAGYVTEESHLMLPVIILLLTCLSSMIFATLATRPIPMTGITTQEAIQEGRANLFFFGNFYRMGLREYDQGMDAVIEKDGNLEAAIKRDLYFLGLSLGKKYNQLRICYNLFMIGVILSVVLFGVSYAIYE